MQQVMLKLKDLTSSHNMVYMLKFNDETTFKS